MARDKKWEEIANTLRKRIIEGEYKPGQKFPSSLELMNEFKTYAGTIQNAVNSLVLEGLIGTYGTGKKRRIVNPLPQRSQRQGGFSSEHGGRGQVDVLDLKLIKSAKKLPDSVKRELDAPVLYYRRLQWRDSLPVAISNTYVPGNLPIQELKKTLAKSPSLYAALEELGIHPDTCEESLVASLPEKEEAELLGLPTPSSIPVVRIIRKIFDAKGNLLELCHLVDRADCYEFCYKFPMSRAKKTDNNRSNLPWYIEYIRKGNPLNNLDFIYRLINENLIIFEDHPLTKEQKERFLKFIGSHNELLSKLFQENENDIPDNYAAHDEGRAPLILKESSPTSSFMLVSDVIEEMFQLYQTETEHNNKSKPE